MCLAGCMEKENLEERGIEGNSLNGGGNRSRFCRFYRDVSLNHHRARAPPKLLEEALANERPKLKLPYNHSKSALANTH